ncbi:MAG: nucleotidyltransferase domain-containing protein [Tagaea sp.]|nr:nucleotidyltransferase domain-containing protein [Tagaea sp.]
MENAAATKAPLRADPMLARVKARLEAEYGPRLLKVVLFGSRARGEAGPDSDYDIAVFLDGFDGSMDEAMRLGRIGSDLRAQIGIDIELVPLSIRQSDPPSPLRYDVDLEGVAL